MTSRERVLLALQHKEADRVAIQDSPWGTTINRWRQEGLPQNVSVSDYFGYEFTGVGADLSFRLPTKVLEETDEYVITQGSMGSIVKNWKHSTSTPELIGFTINSREKYYEHKPLLQWDRSRVNWEAGLAAQEAARKAGKFFTYSSAIGYDKHSSAFGPTTMLIGMVEDPEWIADIFMTDARLNITAVEEMLAGGFEFDAAFLYDDMGYKNGTFFSPKCHRELLMPAHKLLCDFFHSKGMPVILHSCGNVSGFVPLLIEAGFNCLQPLEVKAGMDLIQLKRDYGDRLAFMGGIDVRVMARGNPEEIEEEIRTKVGFAKQGGGYIYHSDHSVPDSVSFKAYCYVIDMVKKYGSY